jgi:hypothetical protein
MIARTALPPRPGSRRHPRWHAVEQQGLPGESPGGQAYQAIDVAGLEVHQESLGTHQDTLARIDLVHPPRVSGRARQRAQARLVGQELAPQGDRLGQVHGQPPDLAVVHPPELGLEAFAQCHDDRPGMIRDKPAYFSIEAEHPERMPLPGRVAAETAEWVVDALDQFDGFRVVQERMRAARC